MQGFGPWGFESGMQDLWLRVWDLGLRVGDVGFRAYRCLGFEVRGWTCRVWGLGLGFRSSAWKCFLRKPLLEGRRTYQVFVGILTALKDTS